jgi:hypothetical protein
MIIYKVTTSICCGCSEVSRGHARVRSSLQWCTSTMVVPPDSARFCGVAWPRETVAAGSAQARRAPPKRPRPDRWQTRRPLCRWPRTPAEARLLEPLLQRVPRQAVFARLWAVCADGEHCEVSVGKVSATTTDADPIGACYSPIWSRMPLFHFSQLVYLPNGDADGTGGRRAVRGNLVEALSVRVL